MKDRKGKVDSLRIHEKEGVAALEVILKEIRRLNERISTATRAAKVGIWDWDVENNRLSWDDQMYSLYGIEREKFNGAYEAWVNGLHPEDRAFSEEESRKAQAGENDYDTEFRVVWPDGSVHYIKSKGEVFRNKNGKVIRMTGVNYDITQHMQAVKDLQLSEEKFNKAFHNSPDAITITRASDGLMVEVNDGLERISGYSREDVIGRTSNELQLWTSTSDRDQYVLLLKENGVVRDFETTFQTKSGEIRHFVLSGELFDLNNTKYILGIIRDITENKKATEKLRLSEELFSNAFNFGPSGITITRISDGMFIDVNQPFLQLFEYTRQEVIGHTSTELKMWSPEERQKLIQQQLVTGGLLNFELLANSKSGRAINILFSSRQMEIRGEACHITTIIDITDRKKAEETVRKKDMEFRRLSSHLPDLIFQFTRRTDGTYFVPVASDGIRNIFGCSPEDVTDDFGPISRVIYPEDTERVISDIEYSADHLTYFECEFRVQIPGKDIQWISSRSTPEKLEDGSITWYGFNADITERKRSEEKLRDSEERWRTLFEILPVGVSILDKNGKISESNQALKDILGFSDHDLRNLEFQNLEYLNSDLRHLEMDEFPDKIALSRNEAVHNIEIGVVKENGETIWIKESAAPLFLPDTSCTVVTTDITERKIRELEINKMKDSLEVLNQHLIDARENERASISREIHDQLGQSLTALKLDLIWLSKKINNDSEESAKLKGMVELVSQTITDVQRISSELRPSILDDLGLASAMEWYCEEFVKRTGLHLDLEVDDVQSVNMVTNLTLYRILQESLTNVIRHSGAGNVAVKLRERSGSIEMLIQDDGVGISKELSESSKSLGIIGMRERLKYAGGKIKIEAMHHGGTSVLVNIPFI